MNTTPDRPWTAGPWSVEHVTDEEGDDWYWIESADGDSPIYGGSDHDEHSPRIAANLALTALAPEMAEALLAWHRIRSLPDDVIASEAAMDAVCELLDDVAEKLRAIDGGDDD